MRLGPPQQYFQRRGDQPPQHQDQGAGQKRALEFERRIFRGGAHQHHGAVFHHRQEGILLAAVEAVDFIDEQQGALADPAALARGFEAFLEIGDATEHGRQLLKMKGECPRQQPCNGGLAGARRTP